MPKPSRDNIQNGLNGWDGTVNNNFIRLFDRPVPIFLHTGDETDIETSFPAASHEECLVVIDHVTLGLMFYMVDQNHPSAAARWVPLSANLPLPPIIQNTTATLDWDDRVVLSDPTGTITLTLRPPAEVAGKTIHIKNLSTNTITVSASALIDGSTTFSLSTQFQSVTVYSDGSTYHIL